MGYNPPGAPTTGGATGLMFPADLVQDNRSLYMEFQFNQWVRTAVLTGGALTPIGSAMYLPMPQAINEVQMENWESEDLTAAKGIFDAVTTANWAAAVPAAAAAAVQSFASGTAVGGIAGATLGMITNPFLTMLYRGPTFKVHRFQWRFAPRNAAESDTMMSIINTFKQNMLPASLAGGAFLGYPNMLELKFSDPGYQNLYTFLPCVVKSAAIDYAPAGAPAFFLPGSAGQTMPAAPVLVNFSVELTEIMFWTQGMYG